MPGAPSACTAPLKVLFLLCGPLLLFLGGFSIQIFHSDDFVRVFCRKSVKFASLAVTKSWGKLTSEGPAAEKCFPSCPWRKQETVSWITARKVTGLQHVKSLHAEINPDIISPNTAKETITVSHKNNPH